MIKRRQILQLGAAALAIRSAGAAATMDDASHSATDSSSDLIQRPIPSSGELLPVIGMGTSRTFDTPGDDDELAKLTALMSAFLAAQGSIIDSSPMYGESESRVGDVLGRLPERPKLFAATKVWTTGKEGGIAQMQTSARRMNVDRFDLIAVHNLQDWKTHLETLNQWKKEGKVRYIGITTSHGRNHNELLNVMRTQTLDFVQFSYNIDDRAAEKELLPLAAERGIATMINRPYQLGSLFGRSGKQQLPDVASDIDCSSWGQFYLKFILGHPAVTSIIPATSKLNHMVDNMKANFGRVPDEQQRAEMLRVFQNL
jgi:aryl-alcohol dehydrogenase-like predicted oxidoreductase